MHDVKKIQDPDLGWEVLEIKQRYLFIRIILIQLLIFQLGHKLLCSVLNLVFSTYANAENHVLYVAEYHMTFLSISVSICVWKS